MEPFTAMSYQESNTRLIVLVAPNTRTIFPLDGIDLFRAIRGQICQRSCIDPSDIHDNGGRMESKATCKCKFDDYQCRIASLVQSVSHKDQCSLLMHGVCLLEPDIPRLLTQIELLTFWA